LRRHGGSSIKPPVPRVTFVNEHRTVEVAQGRLISEAAAELGIKVCREAFIGTGIGDYTVWVKCEPGSLSEPGFLEKLFGIRGTKRYANRARILGDVQVWTQPGVDDRLRSPRPIAPAPRPTEDPNDRLPVDASGTAAFPYGNPQAVGKGERPAIGRSTAKPKAAGAKGKAAAEEESDDEESEDEEKADE
jgi:hypothetical protein